VHNSVILRKGAARAGDIAQELGTSREQVLAQIFLKKEAFVFLERGWIKINPAAEI